MLDAALFWVQRNIQNIVQHAFIESTPHRPWTDVCAARALEHKPPLYCTAESECAWRKARWRWYSGRARNKMYNRVPPGCPWAGMGMRGTGRATRHI
eukprot:5914249-Prymnesium_polylepis.1